MPQKIQRQPRGILGLLGIKSLGLAPDRLADEVIPVLRMEELYLNERRESVASSSGLVAANVTSVATITVPTSEAWFIKELGVEALSWSAVPEQVCFLAVRHQQEPTNALQIPIFQTGPFIVDSTTDRLYDGMVFEEPLLIGPSDVLFLWNLKLLQDAVPATINAVFGFRIRFTRIPL